MQPELGMGPAFSTTANEFDFVSLLLAIAASNAAFIPLAVIELLSRDGPAAAQGSTANVRGQSLAPSKWVKRQGYGKGFETCSKGIY